MPPILLQSTVPDADRHLHRFCKRYQPSAPLLVPHVSGDIPVTVRKVVLNEWLPDRNAILAELQNQHIGLTNMFPDGATLNEIAQSSRLGFYVPQSVTDALHNARRHYAVQALVYDAESHEWPIHLATVVLEAVPGAQVDITITPDLLNLGTDFCAQIQAEYQRIGGLSSTSIAPIEEKRRQGSRGPNQATLAGLEKLREIRKKPKNMRPPWNKACEEAGIDHRTAAKRDLGLKEHWDDTD